MALKIRMRRQGRTNRPFYRLVVMKGTAPRDGKYIESLGWYDPVPTEENFKIESDRVQHWLTNGAIMSEKAEALVGQAAPEILRSYKEQALAKRAKECAKKRERRRKAV